MASRQELLGRIRPDMKLTRSFLISVLGYDMSTPGFAEDVIARLEILGCSKARSYYICTVAEWRHEHDKILKRVAQWYRKQDFEKKEVRNTKYGKRKWREKHRFDGLPQDW